MLNRPRTADKGFSLVELSIVLVILGLLVGGILAGQSLIRASELRAVTSENQRYTTAMGAFRDKYFAIPGDFARASSGFAWTGAADGDGDGMVEGSTTAASNETGHFWHQLVAAGLVEGSYTPASWAAVGTTATSPKSKLPLAFWQMRYVAPVGVDDTVIGTTGGATNVMYEGNYQDAFFLMSGTTLVTPSGGVLRPEEAWNIDTKMDDGRPALGIVLSLESQGHATAGCANPAGLATTSAAAAYDLDNTSATACSLVIKSGY